MTKASLQLRRMIVSALFLSIAIVLKVAFTFDIPLFGQNGMRLGVSSIFSMMPALLVGPVYGMVVAGMSDYLSWVLKPTGAFLPWITVIVAMGGLIRGLLWRVLRNRSGRQQRISVAVCAFALLAFGICNGLFLRADGIDNAFYTQASPDTVSTDGMHWISRMVIDRTVHTANPGGNLATYLMIMTMGLAGGAGFCLLLLCGDWLLSKKADPQPKDRKAMPILISMILPGLVVTTLNTIVLRELLFPQWQALPFTVVWIPRLIESIVENAVMAYFAVLLFGIFQSRNNLRELFGEEKKGS